MIKEIVLHNFKSYAGEQRVGPFHKVDQRIWQHLDVEFFGFVCPWLGPGEASIVQYTLPHAQCFSAVVGPNGSGKSNVIDAMLFVFGKKAKQVGALILGCVLVGYAA